MAVSGSIDFSITAAQAITEAFALIGVAGEGEALSADTMASGLLSANLLLKSWQGSSRMRRWLRQDATMTWTGAATDTTMTPNTLDVYSVIYRRTSSDLYLQQISRDEYLELPNKSSAGSPTCYSLTKERNTQRLWLWPVPPADISLIIDLARVIDDLDVETDDLDIPQAWLEAFVHNLAARLLPKYPGMDPRAAADLRLLAAGMRQTLEGVDEESASVFFAPA